MTRCIKKLFKSNSLVLYFVGQRCSLRNYFFHSFLNAFYITYNIRCYSLVIFIFITSRFITSYSFCNRIKRNTSDLIKNLSFTNNKNIRSQYAVYLHSNTLITNDTTVIYHRSFVCFVLFILQYCVQHIFDLSHKWKSVMMFVVKSF